MIKTITSKEIKDIAKIHKQSMPEAFFSKLGRRFLIYLYTALLRRKAFMGYCAKDRKTGRIQGFITIAYGDNFFSDFVKENFFSFGWQVFKAILTHPTALISLLQTALCIRTDNVSAQTEIFSLGISPENQRKGIGKKLMDKVIIKVKKENKNNCNLKVLVDAAIPANKFYKKQGFTFVQQVSGLGRKINVYTYKSIKK